MPAELVPTGLRLARGGDRGIHVIRPGLGDAGQNLAGRGIDGLEAFTGCRLGPAAADEQPEGAAMLFQPGARLIVALRRGAVFHALENRGDTHRFTPSYASGWWWEAA